MNRDSEGSANSQGGFGVELRVLTSRTQTAKGAITVKEDLV